MKVSVKSGVGGCTGHGRCAVLGAEVYRLDDEGYNLDRGSTIDVAPGLEDVARLGARSCPERALTVSDD